MGLETRWRRVLIEIVIGKSTIHSPGMQHLGTEDTILIILYAVLLAHDMLNSKY